MIPPQFNMLAAGKADALAGSQIRPAATTDQQAGMLESSSKGGMRGAGLLALVIAEVTLKQEAIKLARKYYNINKRDYDGFVAIHQTAMEVTAQEAMSPVDNPVYLHDYYASAAPGMAASSIVDKQWFESRRRAHRYATGAQKVIDMEFAVLRTHGIVAGWNVGRRYEMTYTDEHNNRRFDRQMEVANMGIGVGNIARQGLASAVGRTTQALDNLGDTVASIGNGLATRMGYTAGRRYARDKYGN